MQRGDSVGCCALLSETGGEFVPADWTGEKVDSIADAAEGYLRAGWAGSEDGKSVGSPNVGQASDETAGDDSLRAIGERARRRAIGWDLLASGREIAKILSDAVRGDASTIHRWTLPDATEQKRLAPLWRAASIAVWLDGAWQMIRSDDDVTPDQSPPDQSPPDQSPPVRAPLPAGTYVVVTAHNPMGTRAADPRLNEAAARALAASVRDMRPSPSAVLPTLSVDPVGGFDAWNEPGMAVQLPIETDAQSAEVKTATIRLARRHGQAAVYELTCDSDGGMRIGVTPVFPGLEGLACAGVAAVNGGSPPASMPRSPL